MRWVRSAHLPARSVRAGCLAVSLHNGPETWPLL